MKDNKSTYLIKLKNKTPIKSEDLKTTIFT
jgi:hypothetical protein